MSNKWLWPAPGTTGVSSAYGTRNAPTNGASSNHKGIDISNPGNSDLGNPVVASRGGKVIRSAYSASYGNVIYVSHGDGYETRYAHLNERYVRAGDIVTPGQQIGTIGNTGISTGAHLHFEILADGVSQNPANYVSSDNTLKAPLAVKGNSAKEDASYPNKNGGTSSNSPKSVVARRVSDLTEQPLHSYIRMYIGDQQITTDPNKPNLFQRFECDRLKGGASTIEMTIFDDSWYKIEKLLSDGDNWKNTYIDYGYVTGQKLTNRAFKIILSRYSLSFNETGVFLNLNATSESLYTNLQPISLETKTKLPLVAIRRICEYVGWDLDIDLEGESATSDRENNYDLVNENPATYIQEVIVPEVRTSDNDTIVFHVDENNKAYVRKASYKHTIDTNGDVKTFVYHRGYDSSVINVEFDIKGIFAGAGTTGTISEASSTTYDPTTKEEVTETESVQSITTVSSGEWTDIASDQSKVVVSADGASPNQLKNQLFYSMKTYMMDAYEATVTILGDLEINVTDNIRLIILQDDGQLHHTSGIYMVKKVTDSLVNGNFITTLQVHRNGDIEQGIELLNPYLTVE